MCSRELLVLFVSALTFGAATAVSSSVVRKAATVRTDELNLPLLEDKQSKGVVQKLISEGEGVSYYGPVLIGGQSQLAVYDTGSFDIVVQGGCGHVSTLQCGSTVQRVTQDFHVVNHKSKYGSARLTRKASNVSLIAEPQDDECDEFWKQAEETANQATKESHGHERHHPFKCCEQSKCPFASYKSGASGENFCLVDDNFDSITYGSGTVVTKLGLDHIEFKSSEGKKSIAKQKVPVKLVVNTDLELFQYFKFTTIFGIGPGPFLDKADPDRASRPLYALGIDRFTYCLDHDATRGGLINWNDEDHSKKKGWKKVPISGRSFWSTGIFNFSLQGLPASRGCEHGCAAVIDTGSTLLIVPKVIAKAISKSISDGDIEDCSDLSKFPVLKFTLGMSTGSSISLHEFELGPEAYLTDAGVLAADLAYQHVGKSHFPLLPMKKAEWLSSKSPEVSLAESSVRMCALALETQPCEQDTPQGPEMILGMPLFHKYKVQFDLSRDQQGYPHSASNPSRFMHIGEKAGPACDDAAESSSLRDESKVVLRKMDIWKVPQWIGKNRMYEWRP